jgi:hypothetical protein
LVTKKSPITIDATKIEPSAMPLLESGTMISRMISKRLAPASICIVYQPNPTIALAQILDWLK